MEDQQRYSTEVVIPEKVYRSTVIVTRNTRVSTFKVSVIIYLGIFADFRLGLFVSW